MEHSVGELSLENRISGGNVRIAGLDFNEIHLGSPSIQVLLDTLSQDELDERSLAQERLFFARFGIDAGAACRETMLNFKKQNDLTDGEIATLHCGGSLRYKQGVIVLANRHTFRWSARIALVVVACQGVLQILFAHLCCSGIATVLNDLAALAIGSGQVYCIRRYSLLPALILRKIEERQAGHARSSADGDHQETGLQTTASVIEIGLQRS